ncbi:hypothetical protein ACHAQH_009399 [Verticillium albo-atrum]
MRVAIIGGGPSGLVTLKYLKQAQKFFPGERVEVKLFEAAPKIGGIFFHHVYENAELVSSKFLTCFSDFRPRRDDPDFLSAERYVEYLEEYATEFALWPHIHLSTRVASVVRGDFSGHVVKYETAEGEVEWECDAVAVCSGLHDRPNIPDLKGVENVPVVMHSEKFKHSDQFGVDKTVMVIGVGETSFDICALAINAPTKRVVVCHRHGWFGAPKRIANTRLLPSIWKIPEEENKTFIDGSLPIDVSHLSLFDTSYVHPVARDSMIVWNHYDSVAVGSSWVSTGTVLGFDQFVGSVAPERLHASRLFFNKAWTKVSKHISPPYRPTEATTFGERVRRFMVHTPVEVSDRLIDVAPYPTHIDENGVAHFRDNGGEDYQRIKDEVIKPDVIVFATGYLQSFPFLEAKANTGRKAYPRADEADVREIWKRDDPTVGFIGFVRPGFGAIPPLSELQVMLWIMNLAGQVKKPLSIDDQWHYRIIAPPSARLTYGVEHDSYAFQLAEDMGAVPGVKDVVKLGLTKGTGPFWRLPWIWASAPNFTIKFRLVGPWAWEGATAVMTDDMWEIVSRRKGLFNNFTLGLMPMMQLGPVHLFLFFYALFFNFLAIFGLAKPVKPVSEPKMRIEELARREKKLEGIKTSGTH